MISTIFAVDLTGQRLFLTVEQCVVEVFDLRTNKLVHSITGLAEPHSLVYRADLKKLFVVDGGSAELKVFDANAHESIGSVKLEVDCDSMAFDPVANRMYIVSSGRAAHAPYSFISIVDTTAGCAGSLSRQDVVSAHKTESFLSCGSASWRQGSRASSL